MRRGLWMLACVPAVAGAQDRMFDDAAWRAIERVESPVPSPDGRMIAFTRVVLDGATATHHATVWVMEDDGANPRALGPGRLPDWSPDSRRVAMVDEGAIRIVMVDGSLSPIHYAPKPWRVDQLRWSPDGSWIAYSATHHELAFTAGGAVLAAGAGPGLGRAILLVTPNGVESRTITTTDFQVGLPDAPMPETREFDWVNGATLVVAGRFHQSGRAGESSLVIWDTLASAPRSLPLGEGVWHTPVVSPDRKLIAYVGHASSEAGWTAEELWVVQPNGAAIRRLTPNLDHDVFDIAWAGDNQSLWFATESRGSRNLHRVTTKGDGIKASTTGVHSLVLGGISRRGNYGTVVREQPQAAPAVWRFPTGKPWELRPLFAPNDSVLAGRALGEVEESEFRASDGTAIHTWLYLPPAFDPTQRYPLLVEVHGGPHAMAGAGFAPARLRHVADGWLVLVVNPRGSTGFGGDFANAVARAWPGADGADVLAAVDDVLARGFADSTRMVLLGVGGGGVAVGDLLTRTPRFAAGILRCTGAGWIALGGTGDRTAHGEWLASKPLRLLPELWLDRSPVHRAALVRTPMLTLEGIPTGPRAVEFAESFHLGVSRTGTRTLFVRDAAACGAAAVPGVVTGHERAALRTLVRRP